MLKTYFVKCPKEEQPAADQPQLPPEFLNASSGHDEHDAHHDDEHHDEPVDAAAVRTLKHFTSSLFAQRKEQLLKSSLGV